MLTDTADTTLKRLSKALETNEKLKEQPKKPKAPKPAKKKPSDYSDSDEDTYYEEDEDEVTYAPVVDGKRRERERENRSVFY